MRRFVAALAVSVSLAAPCLAGDTLADALRIIQGKEIVDLTQSFITRVHIRHGSLLPVNEVSSKVIPPSFFHSDKTTDGIDLTASRLQLLGDTIVIRPAFAISFPAPSTCPRDRTIRRA